MREQSGLWRKVLQHRQQNLTNGEALLQPTSLIVLQRCASAGSCWQNSQVTPQKRLDLLKETVTNEAPFQLEAQRKEAGRCFQRP